MFIGHNAVAFAAKRAAPRTSLGTLTAAAMFLDLIWPVFVLAGIEEFEIRAGVTAFSPFDFTYYPWSHSLAVSLVWSFVFGALYFGITKYGRGAVVVGALVFSHWILDFIVHRPDLPLYPGGPKVGLGLWNSVAATVAVEVLMFAAGLWIYARATRARDAVGRRALPALVGFLLVIYLANIIGPPPPGVMAIVVAGIAGAVVIVLWAWWIDRHRTVVER